MISVAAAAESLGMSRQGFSATILPLLIQRGEAQRIGRSWVVEDRQWWQWKLYAATRRHLIAAGVWTPKRPWSVEDCEDIALLDMYEDFQPPAEGALPE
jgi:hypothetical protein